MLNAKTLLLGILTIFLIGFVILWIRQARSRSAATQDEKGGRPSLLNLAIGFVTNFFDTLGIGSFAPTTAIFKLKKLVPDEKIPGTLNIGHTPPTFVQALIFISVVQVEVKTLILLIAASVLGSWLGAGVVARWPRKTIQYGMGLALLVAATLFVIKNLDEMRGAPVIPGGTAMGLEGTWLYVRNYWQFCIGCTDDTRNRIVCAVSDYDQPAWHESASCISNHDGFVCVPDAGSQRKISASRKIRPAFRTWTCIRWCSCSTHCCTDRERIAVDLCAMACCHRCPLHGSLNVAFGKDRKGSTGINSNCETHFRVITFFS